MANPYTTIRENLEQAMIDRGDNILIEEVTQVNSIRTLYFKLGSVTAFLEKIIELEEQWPTGFDNSIKFSEVAGNG